MNQESFPVTLARDAIEYYLNYGQRLPKPEGLPDEWQRQAGVFVSLKQGEELRGCIGTFLPMQPDVVSEIITNAISAATQDPRFNPVDPDELPELTISVDVLSAPEKVDGPADLDPKRYGVIVACGSRRGLLLPDLDGVDTVDEQIRIASRKVGIRADEPVELYRFTVERYF